jgi:hypothetical protein
MKDRKPSRLRRVLRRVWEGFLDGVAAVLRIALSAWDDMV